MNLLRSITITFCLLSLPLFVAASEAQADNPSSCVSQSSWLQPDSATVIDESMVLAQALLNNVVLLGEHHDNQSHHNWQLRILEALYQRQPGLVVGLEMLPRAVQPGINRFLRGDTTTEAFLKEVEWSRYWSFSADYYIPLMVYARDHGIPLIALNVTREKVNEAVDLGWEFAPDGMTVPAQATRPYIRHLVVSFQRHKFSGVKLDMVVEGPAFRRFVQKQLLWDRAMAEGIRAQLDAQQQVPMVVAFIGSGHLMHGYGVPHQLQSLGVEKVMTMIPWDRHLDCSTLVKGFADVVYGAG
ncbi:MAG: ChaN family lipoprotein [Gammaproteobacteria bacterium]|nr:ChaN family lipoprotein [Gammaproteobacteria bacterium]